MADKNKGVSETFGKYTQSSKDRSGKVAGPRNITSDMWTPISTGQSDEKSAKQAERVQHKKNESPYSKKEAQKRKTTSGKKPASQQGLISEGRKKQDDKKKKKPVKKSRIPKGRPVSELGEERGGRKTPKKSGNVRRQQQLSRAERDYDDGIREGKSPGELSKERAGHKRKRRVRQNVVIIVVFLVFALAFAGVYTYSKGAPIGEITVEGDSIYSTEQIISASGIEIGVNMLSLRQSDINGKVCASLPYIQSVQIKRKLPDKLIITVTPATDRLILVNKEKESIVVDRNGKILRDGKGVKLSDGVYRVYGVEWEDSVPGTLLKVTAETKDKYDLATTVADAFEKEGVILRGTVNVSDSNEIRVYYKNTDTETMIYLGKRFGIEERVSFACDVFDSYAVGKKGYINARSDVQVTFGEGSAR